MAASLSSKWFCKLSCFQGYLYFFTSFVCFEVPTRIWFALWIYLRTYNVDRRNYRDTVGFSWCRRGYCLATNQNLFVLWRYCCQISSWQANPFLLFLGGCLIVSSLSRSYSGTVWWSLLLIRDHEPDRFLGPRQLLICKSGQPATQRFAICRF